MYASVSFIQPMSHFRPKPRPPTSVGFDTRGHAVDSSAIIWTSGCSRYAVALSSRRKIDRGQVLAPAVRVRHPLAGLAAVVEVQHRRHPVDAKAVGVEAVHPEHGAREEKASDLVSRVVEDEAAPLGVNPLPRIGVFVEVRAVEEAERVPVARKVRGHPVEDHADAVLVQRVDQVTADRLRRRTGGRARSIRSPGIPTIRRTGAPSRA